MSIPVSFRVIQLSADEASHRVVLQEVRVAQPPRVGAMNGSDAPASIISSEVSPEQFANMRIGQSYELVPLSDLQTSAKASPLLNGPAVYGQHLGSR